MRQVNALMSPVKKNGGKDEFSPYKNHWESPTEMLNDWKIGDRQWYSVAVVHSVAQ